MVIPASSTEYVHVPVTAPDGVDLTGSPPKVAIVAHSDNPAGDEWQTADWADGAARLLVGPDGGTIALGRGRYQVWIAIDPPGAENIVRQAGVLDIA